jgi:hypothetical protein
MDSIKDAPRARRPKTSILPKIVEKVKDLIVIDASFTINALVSLQEPLVQFSDGF